MYAHKEHSPINEDKIQARRSKQVLAQHIKEGKPLTLQIVDNAKKETIELPAGAVTLLMEILGAIASGQGVMIIPQDAELTTAQAAEILNVSRPYLVKLLEDGVIPHHKVGTHRRVQMEHIIRYRQDIREKRAKVLAELVLEAQEEDMGY